MISNYLAHSNKGPSDDSKNRSAWYHTLIILKDKIYVDQRQRGISPLVKQVGMGRAVGAGVGTEN